MESEIRFCTSADGTRIGYTISEGGSELPLLFVSHTFAPIDLDQSLIAGGSLAPAGRRYVRFDRRGSGYSQREVSDLSLDAQVADILAVARASGSTQLDLMGIGDGCIAAATVAGRHPELVRRLVLSTPVLALEDDPARQSLATMIRSNWGLGRGAIADTILGVNTDAETRRSYIRFLRARMSQAMAAAYAEIAWDATPNFGSIVAPTLVITSRRRLGGQIEESQVFAAGIPGARLSVLDSSDFDRAFYSAVWEFLGYGSIPANAAEERLDSASRTGLTMILFADIVDSTGLTERLGDAAFRDKARELDSALRAAIRKANGIPIEGKLLGDGVLATFTSAREAIEAAMACAAAGESAGLLLHVGIHAGDVIEEDGNVFGGAVNIAARVAGESAAGEVLVSQTVRELARTSARVAFEDAGERSLKGVGEPVRMWRIVRELPADSTL